MLDQDADIELCAKAIIGVLKLAPPEKRAAVLACLVRQCAEGALRDRVAPPRLVQPAILPGEPQALRAREETEEERNRRELDERRQADARAAQTEQAAEGSTAWHHARAERGDRGHGVVALGRVSGQRPAGKIDPTGRHEPGDVRAIERGDQRPTHADPTSTPTPSACTFFELA